MMGLKTGGRHIFFILPLFSVKYNQRRHVWSTSPFSPPVYTARWGCNLVFQVLDGKIIKGWNGHEVVQHQDRLLSPTIRQDGVAREVSWDAALDHAAAPYALKPPASTCCRPVAGGAVSEPARPGAAGAWGLLPGVQELHLSQVPLREIRSCMRLGAGQ